MPIRPACPLHLRPSIKPSLRLFPALSTQPFHTTTPKHSPSTDEDHYTTLALPPTSTPAEIKKQFYALSKANHPDLHPNDPQASQRFVKISEAYAVLGSAEKRARYDRDVIRARPSHTHSGGEGGRRGSYSSASTPAGGRPASGLSRRRTQFRGPPPSFYRSGGWGAQGEKRAEHASRASHAHEAAGSSSSAEPGMGPGGFATGSADDVGHFDHRGHYATLSEIERTRHRARRKRAVDAMRAEEEEEARGGGMGMGLAFVAISGVLAVGIGVPGMLITRGSGGMREKE